jgi:hypothetical protein
VVVAAVLLASMVGGGVGAGGAWTITVRVEVDARPALSVTMWAMVSVAAVLVLICTGLISTRLTYVVMPRLRWGGGQIRVTYCTAVTVTIDIGAEVGCAVGQPVVL